MGIDYTSIVLELKKKLLAAEAEKDSLLKAPQNAEVKSRLKHLDEVIDSIKAQLRLLPK